MLAVKEWGRLDTQVDLKQETLVAGIAADTPPSGRDRSLLVLAILRNEISIREAAQRYNVPVETVDEWMTAALRGFRKRLRAPQKLERKYSQLLTRHSEVDALQDESDSNE